MPEQEEKSKKRKLTDSEEQDVFEEFEKEFSEKREAKIPARPFPRKGRGELPEGFVRVRLPRADKNEVLGVILEHFGNKLLIKCIDGFTRICRIPGKIRYKVHIRLGDIALVQKWSVQENEKGDFLLRYTRTQVNQLVKKGLLKKEEMG